MLCWETVAVCCENRTEHTDTLCGQSVPHTEHTDIQWEVRTSQETHGYIVGRLQSPNVLKQAVHFSNSRAVKVLVLGVRQRMEVRQGVSASRINIAY
jgi:hypothetical protein